MKTKIIMNATDRLKDNKRYEASLTVEAALTLPIFLYLMIAFLYFIQIFILQEEFQSSITKMGLSLSKTAYFYKDFPNIEEILHFDKTIFGEELKGEINDITDQLMTGASLKLYAKLYLDEDRINKSCVVDGYDGLDFDSSSIDRDENYLDIVLNYKVSIPVKIFILEDINLIQRVRLRTWTGVEIPSIYETKNKEVKGTIVYITDTGSVYHIDKACSHIRLSVKEVKGIPKDYRNDNGGRYYGCEACCTGEEGDDATYYITSDGTRYHTKRNCSKIKRSVQEILLSEVGSRRACTRCNK